MIVLLAWREIQVAYVNTCVGIRKVKKIEVLFERTVKRLDKVVVIVFTIGMWGEMGNKG
jgi:hypothetical protein